MPVTVVVGGQFGSEGKGKVAHYLTRTMNAAYAVRCGGSNSGHTVVDDSGKTWIFRQLPTAAILPDVRLAVCAGSYIDVEVLLKEIEEAGVSPDRLMIDPEAVVITQECKDAERNAGLVRAIGSTGSGTGAAVAARVQRKQGDIAFAKNTPALQKYIADVPAILRDALRQNKTTIIEGTQGFGLSPLHSGCFPYVTSRDTTAAAFVAEAGLSPCDVNGIALVLRAFPIRVAGNSGPLVHEISWDVLTQEGMHQDEKVEYSSVTQKMRRVGKFDAHVVKRAIMINKPSSIFLNHVDYVHCDIKDNKKMLTGYLEKIEAEIGRIVDFYGVSAGEIYARP